MSIPASLRKKIAESTRLIDLGQESYVSLSKKFNGVKVSTIYDIHQEMLAKDELRNLEEEIGKRKKQLGALDTDFKVLEENYRRKKAVSEEELKGLEGQKRQIEDGFRGHGLTWEQGTRLVAEISNLTEEKTGLLKELPTLRGETKRVRSTLRQLNNQLADLGRAIRLEEGRLDNLLDQISTARNRLSELIEETKAYEDTIIVHRQDERKKRADLKRLTGELQQLEINAETLIKQVKSLKAERETLQSEREEQIKKSKEIAEQIVTEAKQRSERILAAAEEERKRIIAEANTKLKELNAALKGRTEFLKEKLKQLKIDIEKEQRRKAEIEEESEKLVELATERAKLIVEGAEVKREKILKEAEELIDRLKEKSTLKTEEPGMEFPRMVPKEEIQKPPEEFSAPENNVLDREILSRLASMDKSLDKIEERRREKRTKSP